MTTHDWPVAVTTTDILANGMSQTRDEVPPDSEQEFYLTDTRSLRFNELPMPPPEPATETVEVGLEDVGPMPGDLLGSAA